MSHAALHYFRDEPLEGPENMGRDEALLYAPGVTAALRIYGWTPATLSLGYFQRYADVEALPAPLRRLPVVRRTTGGGAILHDREITYCIVLDDSTPVARQAPAALYSLAHQLWAKVLNDEGRATRLAPEDAPFPSPRSGPFFCFEKPGRTDLLLEGGKVLGSAQRRIPGRVLQHGSLILGRDASAAQPGADLGDPAKEEVQRWIARFASSLATALELELRPAQWTEALLEDAARRRVRYASDEWMFRR